MCCDSRRGVKVESLRSNVRVTNPINVFESLRAEISRHAYGMKRTDPSAAHNERSNGGKMSAWERMLCSLGINTSLLITTCKGAASKDARSLCAVARLKNTATVLLACL